MGNDRCDKPWLISRYTTTRVVGMIPGIAQVKGMGELSTEAKHTPAPHPLGALMPGMEKVSSS